MTEEEIEEGNKLIANFMTDGQTVRTSGGARAYLINGIQKKVESLEFHSSWDWLMPVVEKIEEVGHDVWLQSVHNRQLSQCTVWNGNYVLNLHKDESKIVATWLTVVDFIKWYNSQSATIKPN